jgi:transcriptional regulator GlxA family with amidase domain
LDAGRLRLVMEAIHKNIGEPISVSMLCSAAGLSRSHFSRAFRTSVGQSPHAYIVRLRLERAMSLMRDTETPLSEIALVAGFSDQPHFSNAFRRAVGTTPAQWRRSKRTRSAPSTNRQANAHPYKYAAAPVDRIAQ